MYSNCLIESLKAWMKSPLNAKIHAVPAKFSPLCTPIPHFWWSVGNDAYEFVSLKKRRFQVFLFKGETEHKSIEEMNNKILRQIRLYAERVSKKYGDIFDEDKIHFVNSVDYRKPKLNGDSSPTILVYYENEKTICSRLIDSRELDSVKNLLGWKYASTEGSHFALNYKIERNEDGKYF
jgi:hypothetical protein